MYDNLKMIHSVFKKVIFLSLFTMNFVLWTEEQEIKIYTYHTLAPFLIGESSGLTYDLADYLTEKSDNLYIFTVNPMPRSRIDRLLDKDEPFILPWVSPEWFNDDNEEIFMWSQNIIMKDGNAVISNMENKIDYSNSNSVLGLRFGGVSGHNYLDIDDLVEAGKIERFDNENHLNNFRMLLKKRIDFTITPLAGAEYIIKTNQMDEKLYISSILHSEYERRVIISHRDPELLIFIDSVLSGIQYDPKWNAILAKYK